jgi:NAD(P)-dependent dehydrogenase (short-subunit alcohol dehydrogenase family)
MIHTPLTEAIYCDANVAARRNTLVPLGRVGAPDDVASVVSFLAGENIRYVPGEAIRVDGGFALPIVPTCRASLRGRRTREVDAPSA